MTQLRRIARSISNNNNYYNSNNSSSNNNNNELEKVAIANALQLEAVRRRTIRSGP